MTGQVKDQVHQKQELHYGFEEIPRGDVEDGLSVQDGQYGDGNLPQNPSAGWKVKAQADDDDVQGIASSKDTSAEEVRPNAGSAPYTASALQAEGDKAPFMKSPSVKPVRPGRQSSDTTGIRTLNKMHKFSLYETCNRFYLVGGNMMDNRFRILKIDRTAPPGQLHIVEDDMVYNKKEMNELLSTIDDGFKANGGMKLKCSTWGLLGFIRFTEAYYMLLITKRQQRAMIGGHYVYQIDGTELIPLTTGSTTRFQQNRNPQEARCLAILNNLDLSRSFYFSYSYNITRTLQHNIIRERERLASSENARVKEEDLNSMFVWNHWILDPARRAIKNTYDWCLPVIHGFIDQAEIDIFGRSIYITIIARRSRFFAGARFLKRGTNDLGYVANDVETEQIVSEMTTTSFHAPGPRLYANPNYTSYVQHRGSIPLYWTQDNSGVSPKPDIDLNLVDPFYSAAALHFDNLFYRYGAPIHALNLIKARERTPRESKLLSEYKNAILYLNQFLAEDKKIKYAAFDMSRAAKTRSQDVIGTLEVIAEEIVNDTGFFHNGEEDVDHPSVQNGVARTNCIDCLDRTNAAQFVIGKRALGRQLHALGVIADDYVDYDTDAIDLYTHMFHDHGDTIAIQYGGSHLVNTLQSYRRINHWQSNSRDMVESFKRYYHNSFLDSQRQEAYNLFLGNYIFAQGQPMLWDLTTDYYLHHADPRMWCENEHRNYITWFTEENLRRRKLPPANGEHMRLVDDEVRHVDDYWQEYYRPLAVSSFLKIFSYRMNSTVRYLPEKSTQHNHRDDLSPFRVRKDSNETEPSEKSGRRKGVTIVDPHSAEPVSASSQASRDNNESATATKSTPLAIWLASSVKEKPTKHSILRAPHFEMGGLPSSEPATALPSNSKLSEKSPTTQWTLNQFYDNSFNPSVTDAEADEYEHYIMHPQNLPLVTSSKLSEADTNLEYVEYVSSFSSQPVTPWDTSFLDAEDIEFLPPLDDVVPSKTEKHFNVSEEVLADYEDFLTVGVNPLTVTEEDGEGKRYKAYRQWLRGKSLFKQSKVDPEYKAQT